MQGNNLLDVLKKKMRQTKEEMEKYKEESEDMARKLQVEIRRREEVSLRHHQPTRPLPGPLSPRAAGSLQKFDPGLRVARKSVEAFAAGSCGTLVLWHQLLLPALLDLGWDESEWSSGFEPVSGSSSSPDPRLRIVTWHTGGCTTPPPGQHSNPSCPKKGIRPLGGLADAVVVRPARTSLSLSFQ